MILKKTYPIHFFLFFIVNLSLCIYAQPENIKFSHISIEQGLSQNSIFSMVQDNAGFIWMGTETGINKYDGYGFVVFAPEIDNPNSLSDRNASTICIDHAGILWIGTQNGFNRLDPATERFTVYNHDPDDSGSISNSFIYSIYEDSFENLWIGTKHGLNRFDKENNRFIRYYHSPDNPDGLSGNEIRAIFQDRSGLLWIGTYGGGLNKYDRTNDRFFSYKNIPEDSFSLSDNRVLCIFEDNAGNVWIGTEEGGLNRFDHEKGVFSQYKNDPDNAHSISDNTVNVIYEDKAGALWIGTEFGGLNIFDREKNHFIHYTNNPDDPSSIGTNRVVSILEDNQGGLWFGTRGGGLNLFNRQTHKFVHYKGSLASPNSLNCSQIWELYEDRNGIIWIGTGSGGLNRFDRKKNLFTHFVHDPKNSNSICHNRVNAIREDTTGTLWLATYGGLDALDRTTGRFTHYVHTPGDSAGLSENKVFSLCIDRSGTLWVGTFGGGLDMFDSKKKSFIHYRYNPDNPGSINCDNIMAINEDRSGVLWLGTYGGGLNRFDRTDGRFTYYQVDKKKLNSITGNFILSLGEDASGSLWIGTGYGLSKFDKNSGTFTNFTQKNGLPDNVIYDIVEDDSRNLWITTNKGVSKFNPQAGIFKNYDVSDGLQSNEFNTGTGCKLRSGEILFGGINGFNLFHPDSIKDNPFIPPVIITEFQLFNTNVPIGAMEDGRSILTNHISKTKQVTLSYKDNVFSFGFVALNYVFTEKNLYAYKMEGLEKKWNYVGNRRYATYTTLPPGKYTFRVKGSNNDGIWNETGTSLKITVTPPYWKTWWFYLLCFIILTITAVAAYTNHINRLKKQKEEEERLKVITDVSQVLEHGKATIYRRNRKTDEYEYIGNGIKDISGYTPKEITLSLWRSIVISIELIGEQSDLSLEEAFDRMQNGKINSFVMDFNLRTKAGDIRWARDISTALRDESGNCYGYLGIIFDITDRKLAEQELARTTEELGVKNKEMEKDLNMARDIQMSLLSQYLPCFPKERRPGQSALHFLYRYIPASTLGGDFFEIFPVSDHEVGIIIYDIMGHGVRASLLTTYFHGLIEDLLPIATDPVAIMKRLNIGLNAVAAQYDAGIFATAFYMVADIKTGTMRYVNAGHPMPCVLRPEAESIERLQLHIKKVEPALGLVKDFNYTSSEQPMQNNDIVFFYTDGIYEVDDKNKTLFGESRLLHAIKNQIKTPFEQMLDGVLSEIKDFAGTDEFRDDVCIVGMQVKKV